MVSTGFSIQRIGFSAVVGHVGFVTTVAVVASAAVELEVVILVVSLLQ